MPTAGDTLTNPATGARAVIRARGDHPDAAPLHADLFLPPGHPAVGVHLHPRAEEVLTVLSGRVRLHLDGLTLNAPRNQRIVVPAGARHTWRNAGDTEAHVLLEVPRDARHEAMLWRQLGLTPGERTGWLQRALFAREFRREVVFTRAPRAVQALAFALLAPLARPLEGA